MSSTMSADPTLARRRRAVTALAWAVVAAMLATVALSAYMRLVQAGVGCSPWPACFAQGAAAEAGASMGLALARLLHRVVASLVLVLTLLLVLITLATRPRMKAQGASALALLLLTLALAALGVTMRGSTAPPVVLGNLLGGFAMFALCLRLALASRDDAAGHGGLRRPAGWALLALLLAIVLGALASATALPPSCDGWRECLEAARVAGWDWQIVNPWFAPTTGAGPGVLQRDAWLQLLHRGAGLLALLTLLRLDWAAWRQRAHAGTTPLAVLVALELLLLASALLPVGLAQALAHNLAAALLLGWLARWA